MNSSSTVSVIMDETGLPLWLADELDRLVAIAEGCHLSDDALDNAVVDLHLSLYGCAGANTTPDESSQETIISESEISVSEINNSGFRKQIRFLLIHARDGLEDLIRAAAPTS